MKKMTPIHPGDVLKNEFLIPFGLTEYRLAKEIHVPARRINEIIHGDRAISADTALRLARFFGTTAQFWLNLQSHYEIELWSDRCLKQINKEVRTLVAV